MAAWRGHAYFQYHHHKCLSYLHLVYDWCANLIEENTLMYRSSTEKELSFEYMNFMVIDTL